MLLADSNIWLALALSKHIFHRSVRGWLARRPARDPLAFCRFTQLTFLRLITTSAVMGQYGIPPLSNAAAWSVYERFRANKRISVVGEPTGLDQQWGDLAGRPTASPKLWMDAYLAAFAITGRHRLVTTDAAFRQFADLDVLVLPG